ncbi:MAG: phosphatase PAP2 family protein [Myxococcales bacterium]|nr:phosphatase PAP2 family protein [Myxococcales bacterium]
MSRYASGPEGLRRRGALVVAALTTAACLAATAARAQGDARDANDANDANDAGAPLVTWGTADAAVGPTEATGDGGAPEPAAGADPADAGGEAPGTGTASGAAGAEDQEDWDDWDDEDDDEPTDPIVWRADWPRFGLGDWIITGSGAALALGTAIVAPQPKHTFGGYAFDESVRRSLRLPSSNLRFAARDASDILVSLEATWPFFVDAAITTWWYHHSPDAAAQMAAVNAEAIAVITGLQGVTNTIASRERPYGRDCGTSVLPDQTVECEGNVRYRSFFSGHSAFSFTAASLICTNHLKLGLFGGGAAEIATCIIAYGGAAAAASLRVMGDMHYATDVLTGAFVGTVVGVGIPLLHYRSVGLSDDRPHHLGQVRVMPVGTGVGVGGTF